jgi:hypothetical protein
VNSPLDSTVLLPEFCPSIRDEQYTKILFGGRYQAEATFDGYTIPSQMGAGWWLRTDRYFEFFRVTIEKATF